MRAIVIILSFILISTAKAGKPLPMHRILHGDIAHPGQFPYTVYVFCYGITDVITGVGWGISCGGALISEDFVLTAKHCLVGERIVHVKLIFGSTSSEHDLEEPNRVVLEVPEENIILHEGRNDIALVRLNQKIKTTYWIKPIRLPARSQTNLDWEVAYITGWGLIGNTPGDRKALRFSQSRILPNKTCTDDLGDIYYDTNLCIDGANQSPCRGDSGGPAAIFDRKDNNYTLVGIISAVAPGGCDKGRPAIYMRVTNYLDWIHNHTGIPIID